MRRLVLAAMLLAAASAHAEWKWLGAPSSQVYQEYYDPATVRPQGGKVRFWLMRDYARPYTDSTGDTYSSEKLLRAVDCNTESAATFSIIQYSGKTGSGRVVYSGVFDDPKWSPAAPGTMAETHVEVACGR